MAPKRQTLAHRINFSRGIHLDAVNEGFFHEKNEIIAIVFPALHSASPGCLRLPRGCLLLKALKRKLRGG